MKNLHGLGLGLILTWLAACSDSKFTSMSGAKESPKKEAAQAVTTEQKEVYVSNAGGGGTTTVSGGGTTTGASGGGGDRCTTTARERSYNAVGDEITYLVSSYWNKQQITIKIFDDGKPVKLLLRSYEAQRWIIENPSGVEVRALIGTSNGMSTVTGVPVENVKLYGESELQPYNSWIGSSPALNPSDPHNLEWLNKFSANAGMIITKGYYAEHLCAVELKLAVVSEILQGRPY